MARIKNMKTVKTSDGHIANIIQRKNALAFFWKSYQVDVMSNCLHSGNKRDTIYSFKTGASFNEAVKQARAWTAEKIFARNPYLLKAAEAYATNVNP